MKELLRYVDGEAARDIVDEAEIVGKWKEFDSVHAKSVVEESMQFAYHRGLTLVGHGQVTNGRCGFFGVFSGCLRTELHDRMELMDVFGVELEGEGKAYIRHYQHSCDRMTCPKCYRHAAFRESVSAEARLDAVKKHYGLIEHVILSPPLRLHEVNEVKLREMGRKILFKCGVIGGCIVFHPFRYNELEHWYFSPHFHVLGFISGGYKCRRCEKLDYASNSTCKGCDGLENVVRKMNDVDEWILKIARDRVTGKVEVRRSVRKTIQYELAHAGVREGVRGHVLTWFGIVSYRKLHVTKERAKALCPLCKHELIPLKYIGNDAEVLNRIKWGICGSFFDVLKDGKGSECWIAAPVDRFGRRID